MTEMSLSLKDSVVQTLRNEILSGALEPGDPIKDVELSTRLSVSITPVREAVAQLIKEGLIESLPNKRRRVTALSIETATELMDVLGVLLCAALRRATPSLGAAGVAEARSAVADYRRASDARRARDARDALDRFVHLVTGAAANRQLAELVDTAATRSYRLIGLTASSPLWGVWAQSLEDVMDLLEDGKGTRAANRLERHFAGVVSAMKVASVDAGVILGPVF